jgi:hypothetical protein
LGQGGDRRARPAELGGGGRSSGSGERSDAGGVWRGCREAMVSSREGGVAQVVKLIVRWQWLRDGGNDMVLK